MTFNYSARRTKLTRASAEMEKELDSFVIKSLPNLSYFFNYEGESFERFSGGLISSDGKDCVLVVPALDIQKARRSDVNSVFAWTDSEGFEGALKKAKSYLGIEARNIGCEDSITLGMMDSIRSVIGQDSTKFQSVSSGISDIRLIKEPQEIQEIKKSARILEKAYEFVQRAIKRGMTEVEAGNEIRDFITEKGAQVDFLAIQSGRNSSIPHSSVTNKEIEKQDMIVVDISIRNEEGYFADFTRTYTVGKATSKQRKVYDVVKKAQERGVNTVEEGAPASTVDSETRSVIEGAGYGDYFVHRTGHGIGLEVHERPWICEGNKERLGEGMAFTIAPGIYLRGAFGVRIEDNIVISEGGRVENLGERLTHELVEL